MCMCVCGVLTCVLCVWCVCMCDCMCHACMCVCFCCLFYWILLRQDIATPQTSAGLCLLRAGVTDVRHFSFYLFSAQFAPRRLPSWRCTSWHMLHSGRLVGADRMRVSGDTCSAMLDAVLYRGHSVVAAVVMLLSHTPTRRPLFHQPFHSCSHSDMTRSLPSSPTQCTWEQCVHSSDYC